MPLFPNPTMKRKPTIRFLDSIFNHFNSNQVVLLLLKERLTQSINHILDKTLSNFGKNNVLHLKPYSESSVQVSEYLGELTGQYGYPSDVLIIEDHYCPK